MPRAAQGTRPERVGVSTDVLGEGPVWDEHENCAYYVDILRHRVYRLDGTDLSNRTLVHQSDREVTCVVLATDGGLLIVERDRLVTRSPDGVVGVGSTLIQNPAQRFNDGGCDPQGRLLIGTLCDGKSGEVAEESVLRIDAAGGVQTLLDGVALSNGLAFDVPGRTLHHVDTLRARVTTYDYTTSSPTPISSFQVVDGHPDGLTVDAEGYLWIAVWGGAEVRRYSPLGELERRVSVPASQPTAAEFVGDRLDRLLITTATAGIEQPGAGDGGLFLAAPGVSGLPTRRWLGSTRSPEWLAP